MMEPLRAHLRDQLERKVSAHGLVVWDDPAREYTGSSRSVVPPRARYAEWEGSWFQLRREVESALSGDQPPALVIYLAAAAPAEDPLAEIRASGGAFKVRLQTLVKQALAGELTETRLREIGEQAETLEQAEAAIAAATDADVRLVAALGTSDTTQMAIRLLLGEADSAIDEQALWAVVVSWLSKAFGGSFEGYGEDLRRALMRHLILTELAHHIGELPDALGAGWTSPSTDERGRSLAVLDAWRRDRHRIASYAERAAGVDRDLRVEEVLEWHESLAQLDSLPSVERLAFQEAVVQLANGEFARARHLAETRLQTSLWVRERPPAPLEGVETWGPKWRTALGVALLQLLLEVTPAPPKDGGGCLHWYVDHGWKVDQAHRNLEVAMSDLHAEGILEEAIGPARRAYEKWLEQVLTTFTSAVEGQSLTADGVLRQGEIHSKHVAKAEGPVAYIWADAFRYEVGAELAQALSESTQVGSVEFEPAVAAVPTITPVGMANLCPGAETGLELNLDGERLTVAISGRRVKGVPDRVELLRAAHGEVVNLTLQDVFDQGEKQLGRKIESASLVLVRSQEMDAAGESGMLAVAWSNFELVKQQLVRAVARLGQAGVRRVVISADHGFIALSRGLGRDRVVDAPKGGTGELHRRGWVGRGGMDSPSTVRLALSDAGIKSDLDLIAPRGLAVFAAGGARRFFHGGLSPQELLVPVVVCEPQKAVAPQKLRIRVSVAGDRITTGVFSASVEFDPDLLRSEVDVRITATRRSDGDPVARIVAGDGYDSVSGKVTVTAEKPAVLTFQVTENLSMGDDVQVQVFDASTDRLLEETVVSVAAPVEVEEEL